MAKRKYTKTSPYWDRLSKNYVEEKQEISPDINYEEISLASTSTVADSSTSTLRSGRGRGLGSVITTEQKYELISKEFLPYENSGGKVTVSSAIELSQKAAAGVPIVRNTIEVMTEFSTTKIHVISKNKKAKAFVQAWLEKIKLRKIQEQFFREYYRSGNVFFYRFNGVFDDEDQERIKNVFGARLDEIPLRYELLHPNNIGVESGLVPNDGTFIKILTPFEATRLRKPITKLEKDIVNNLSQEVKDQLKKSTGPVVIKLDLSRLRFIFYKKQDYEPLATPMLYPILKDIEQKLQLKRADRILAKTIDSIILLITLGAEPEKGGINVKNIGRIEALLRNPSFGRTLVADYTTKAEFVIPPLEKILGPEKYEQVDKDIKEGLQNATLGENRFADTFVKVKVFIERLNDGQEVFLTEFLEPEIREICDRMNFRDCPTVRFEKISLHDPNVFNKTVVRMMELGILTPDEAFKVMESHLFPEKQSNIEAQEEYKKLKDKGLYDPLIGGKNKNEAGRPDNTPGSPRDSNTPGIQVQATDYNKFTEVVKATNNLITKAGNLLKKKTNKKRLTKTLKNLADVVACDIIINSEMEDWDTILENNIQTQQPSNVSEVSSKVAEIAEQLDMELYDAAIIYHSQQE
jgi:hypothetical protein